METLTLLFVAGMLVAAILVTLIVRRDFLANKELERQNPSPLPPKIRRR
ncbi:MAG TPA: hypothetical protein VFS10_04520 [Pyrinomonadaceae bacterium]|nr:hypothetical protein [Pyrinomonadaceae bacterium]